MATNIYAGLPRIIAFAGIDDAGEFGAANCPHCGAQGRYIYRFVVEGGERLGAMRGCLKRFPKSPLAVEHQKIMERKHDYKQRGGSLASWDVAILEAIDRVAQGQMSEQAALDVVREQRRRQAIYLQRRYGRR